MAMTCGKVWSLAFYGLCIVALLADCSGRKISTSAEDQSLSHSQEPRSQSASAASSTSSEASRITESTITSPLVPSDTASPPVQNKPIQSNALQPSATSSLSLGSLGDVFFDYDRFALRQEAKTTLESNARGLKGKKGGKILIEGHCDERGTSAYNLVLGERRAQSVKRYLQELGVPVLQLQTTSYGKERPFCREHGEPCWQQNRRVHFVVR